MQGKEKRAALYSTENEQIRKMFDYVLELNAKDINVEVRVITKKKDEEPDHEGVNKDDSREGIRAYARGRAYIPGRFGGVTPYTDPDALIRAKAEAAQAGRQGKKEQQKPQEEPAQKAAAPAEEAALTAAETFNSQFRDWAAADGFDEVTAWAEEDRAGRAETGAAWTPYVLELESEVCRTGDLISVQAVYYGSSGGAHPNTVLMAWNFDLSTGRFLTPEQLAADGQAFSEAVAQELLRQSRETAAAYDMAPEDFFWTNYQEILAGWSSYAVSFDGEGMTVGFSPYELAAYAAGPQIYHLPYEQLAGYFSTHGLALLGLAATEK